MLFGALGPCPVCTSCLYYYGGHYQCNGYVSEWSKCTYTTTQPVRIKKKWKIPDELKNDYLTKVGSLGASQAIFFTSQVRDQRLRANVEFEPLATSLIFFFSFAPCVHIHVNICVFLFINRNHTIGDYPTISK
jgi:hypothetical protein